MKIQNFYYCTLLKNAFNEQDVNFILMTMRSDILHEIEACQ